MLCSIEALRQHMIDLMSRNQKRGERAKFVRYESQLSNVDECKFDIQCNLVKYSWETFLLFPGKLQLQSTSSTWVTRVSGARRVLRVSRVSRVPWILRDL